MIIKPQEKIKILFNLDSMNSETVLNFVIASLSKLNLPESFQINKNIISTNELKKALSKNTNKWQAA